MKIKKGNSFEDEMIKRPERELYIPPALRYKFNDDCEDKIENVHDEYASDTASRHDYSFGYRDGSLRRSTNIVRRRVRFESSSLSNPRSESDKSFKDDDSSDFEECCSAFTEPVNNDASSMGSSGNNSNDYWKEEGTGNHAKNDFYIETDAKSRANKSLNSASNEAKLDRGLYFNYDYGSISDNEAIIDSPMNKGRLLTPTSNSDIVEKKVLDAAESDPEEESVLESTLIDQSDIRETTINTNRNKCDKIFDIYQGPSSVKSRPSNFSEIFGNNYIPPPVPPPISAFLLPPIHRLPSPVPSSNQVLKSSQKIPQLPIQLPHPRLLHPPSLQQYSLVLSPPIPSNSSHMPSVPRCLLSPHLQPVTFCAPNRPRVPSSISPTLLPQERLYPPHLSQDASNLHLHQRSHSPQSLESYKKDDAVYIHPPVAPPQQIHRSQQIRNLKQRETVQSCQPDSISLENKIIFDEKIWPQNQKTRR